MLKLPNETLAEILDHIESDPEKLVNVDRRAYLSQESFRPPPLPTPDQAQDIGNFRLVCKRFSELGAVPQFATVTTRFSRKGFRRLENIASQAHLARSVKKFSYMVPYFYEQGRQRLHDVVPDRRGGLGTLDVRVFDRKMRDQMDILGNEEDARALKKAMAAFTTLQHVQILRVQDREDALLLTYIRQHQNLTQPVSLQWEPACSRSSKTIGAALLASRSPFSRFSSPMLCLQSVTQLAAEARQTAGTLAQRLTSLELHFDDNTDLDRKMLELSDLFRTVFEAAVNMTAIHIGFPSHRPISLPLEAIFHEIQWEKLSAFGIQGWKLNADEIVALARRHRRGLKGLRLRDVLLKEDSMWKDVLPFLRDSMTRLAWVSLRRIGYAKHFDEQWAAAGIEVHDDPPGGGSESDEETDSDADDQSAGGRVSTANRTSASRSNSDDDDSDDSNGEHGPRAHEIEFPRHTVAPDTPSSAPWCNCNGRSSDNPEAELGDNGVFVSNFQRKMWEKWVVRRCPEHNVN